MADRDLAALADEVEGTEPQGGSRSWYDRIDGDEKAFFDLMVERKRNGANVEPTPLLRVMEREFGTNVTPSTLGRTLERRVKALDDQEKTKP